MGARPRGTAAATARSYRPITTRHSPTGSSNTASASNDFEYCVPAVIAVNLRACRCRLYYSLSHYGILCVLIRSQSCTWIECGRRLHEAEAPTHLRAALRTCGLWRGRSSPARAALAGAEFAGPRESAARSRTMNSTFCPLGLASRVSHFRPLLVVLRVRPVVLLVESAFACDIVLLIKCTYD